MLLTYIYGAVKGESLQDIYNNDVGLPALQKQTDTVTISQFIWG